MLHIEEDHHKVLNHIMRDVGRKKLPLNGIGLLHFVLAV